MEGIRHVFPSSRAQRSVSETPNSLVALASLDNPPLLALFLLLTSVLYLKL